MGRCGTSPTVLQSENGKILGQSDRRCNHGNRLAILFLVFRVRDAPGSKRTLVAKLTKVSSGPVKFKKAVNEKCVF